MSESTLSPAPATQSAAVLPVVQAQPCEECLGSGGWYRYEPALDPAPGVLYLFCLQCRGSGRTAWPRD
jgi:hypothetical protein